MIKNTFNIILNNNAYNNLQMQISYESNDFKSTAEFELNFLNALAKQDNIAYMDTDIFENYIKNAAKEINADCSVKIDDIDTFLEEDELSERTYMIHSQHEVNSFGMYEKIYDDSLVDIYNLEDFMKNHNLKTSDIKDFDKELLEISDFLTNNVIGEYINMMLPENFDMTEYDVKDLEKSFEKLFKNTISEILSHNGLKQSDFKDSYDVVSDKKLLEGLEDKYKLSEDGDYFCITLGEDKSLEMELQFLDGRDDSAMFSSNGINKGVVCRIEADFNNEHNTYVASGKVKEIIDLAVEKSNTPEIKQKKKVTKKSRNRNRM